MHNAGGYILLIELLAFRMYIVGTCCHTIDFHNKQLWLAM